MVLAVTSREKGNPEEERQGRSSQIKSAQLRALRVVDGGSLHINATNVNATHPPPPPPTPPWLAFFLSGTAAEKPMEVFLIELSDYPSTVFIVQGQSVLAAGEVGMV
jgi:hypothetical protein